MGSGNVSVGKALLTLIAPFALLSAVSCADERGYADRSKCRSRCERV